ncbi:MAG: histidine kinase [Saprospiraceae bacterium]|nr:histidine kinase [Saprospiraceae bacterium]
MLEPAIIKTWPVEGISRIETEALFGNVYVAGHESSKIRVEISVRNFGWPVLFTARNAHSILKDYELHLEQQDDVLHIKSSLKGHVINWLRFAGLRFRILLPMHKPVQTSLRLEAGNIRLNDCEGRFYASTGAGTLRFERVVGEVEGKTAAGTVEIGHCRGNISAQTSAGTIEVSDCEGTMSFSTSAGTIEMERLIGNVYATSAAGTVEANDIDGVLKVHTSAGTIEVSGMNGSLGASTNIGTIEVEVLALGDFLHLETQAGNIDVKMPFDKGADLTITGYTVRTPQLDQFEGIRERDRIEGALHGGGIPVQIRAHAGNVKIGQGRLNAFSSINKSIKENQFTLPLNFFQWNLRGFLLSLIICITLTYGVNSIFYFSIELSNGNVLSGIYIGIVLGNLVNALIVLLIVAMFTRYFVPKIKRNWVKYALLNMFSLFGSIVAQIILVICYWQYANIPENTEDSLNMAYLYLFIPCIVASIYFFFWQRSQQITRKISEQEYQLVSLEKLKTRAELDALQARINPHFLYNALNSIAGLVHEDADKAERMTLLLSKLFRFTIGIKDQHFNTLEHELDIVRTYLDIEQVRFGPRLTYLLQVEEGLSQVKIPVFLLQPIVENAIKHGISKISGEGRIEVHIARQNDHLILRIHDNGPPFSENFFTGYGLQSIQDKLQLLYDHRASFDIQNNDYKQVIIELPC